MEEPILKVQNLSVKFEEEKVIRNLSFEVKRGDFLIVLGPNGAGKTTLFKAILEALASGTPVVGLSNETIDEFIDETCGYCLPKKTAPPEFARKVKAICSLPKEEYEKLRKRASKKVQFLDWQEIVPQTIAVYRRLAERETEKNKKFS
jgi:ABC-type Mn2+/Zn2+ transport system ATPase subunit